MITSTIFFSDKNKNQKHFFSFVSCKNQPRKVAFLNNCLPDRGLARISPGSGRFEIHKGLACKGTRERSMNGCKPTWWDEQERREARLLTVLEREENRRMACSSTAPRIPSPSISAPFSGSTMLRGMGDNWLGLGRDQYLSFQNHFRATQLCPNLLLSSSSPALASTGSAVSALSKGSTVAGGGGLYRECSDDLAHLDSLCSSASTVCTSVSSLSWTVSVPSLTTSNPSISPSTSLSAGPSSSCDFPAGSLDSHRATSALARAARQHRSHPYQKPAAADCLKSRHRPETTVNKDKDSFEELRSVGTNSLGLSLNNPSVVASAECDDSEWTLGAGNPI